MSVRTAPEATYLEPLLGWRFWRVELIQTLDHGRRFRLCAAGGLGHPKLWAPRVATAAHCSDRWSSHEAPHPAHECGLYAYAERADAEQKLVASASYRASYSAKKATKWAPDRTPAYETWAIGRVSLWGRVVECELGWRAQYAYPYDLAVFTNGRTAEKIAAEYATDTTAVPRRALRSLISKHAEVAAEAKGLAEHDQWYQESIYGIMDRKFLKPYHEQTMRRLDRLERAVTSLAASSADGEAKNASHA